MSCQALRSVLDASPRGSAVLQQLRYPDSRGVLVPRFVRVVPNQASGVEDHQQGAQVVERGCHERVEESQRTNSNTASVDPECDTVVLPLAGVAFIYLAQQLAE